MTEPKKPGRPATGRKPQPAYQADSKAALLEAGGRRLTVNLGPVATQDLEAIQRATAAKTAREAIELALRAYAKSHQRIKRVHP